jgi:hypothetical protein
MIAGAIAACFNELSGAERLMNNMAKIQYPGNKIKFIRYFKKEMF